MMMDWLEYYEIPYLLILTKSDKLPISKLSRQLEAYRTRFNSQLTEGSCRGIVPFSIVTSDGKSELLRLIDAHLNQSRSQKKEAV
jgi:GTP-binding protein